MNMQPADGRNPVQYMSSEFHPKLFTGFFHQLYELLGMMPGLVVNGLQMACRPLKSLL